MFYCKNKTIILYFLLDPWKYLQESLWLSSVSFENSVKSFWLINENLPILLMIYISISYLTCSCKLKRSLFSCLDIYLNHCFHLAFITFFSTKMYECICSAFAFVILYTILQNYILRYSVPCNILVYALYVVIQLLEFTFFFPEALNLTSQVEDHNI